MRVRAVQYLSDTPLNLELILNLALPRFKSMDHAEKRRLLLPKEVGCCNSRGVAPTPKSRGRRAYEPRHSSARVGLSPKPGAKKFHKEEMRRKKPGISVNACQWIKYDLPLNWKPAQRLNERNNIE